MHITQIGNSASFPMCGSENRKISHFQRIRRVLVAEGALSWGSTDAEDCRARAAVFRAFAGETMIPEIRDELLLLAEGFNDLAASLEIEQDHSTAIGGKAKCADR